MQDQPPKGPNPGFTPSIDDLKKTSQELREKIEEEKRRTDMPIDSHLGDPEWEEKAKDGRFDKPDDDDE